MAKTLVDKADLVEPGATYEIVIDVKGKYDVKNVNRVLAVLRTGESLADMIPFYKMSDVWEIQSVVAESDIWRDVVPMVNTGPSEIWRLRIIAKKTETGTPVFVAVGVILALLILLVGVVGWQAHKLEGVAEKVLNPVVIVAAALIAALIFLGRK